MPLFRRYIGITYSGAATSESPLPGLRVYSATPDMEPVEIRPPEPSQMHWTRQTLAHWLAEELLDNPATIVGIDHAFSFPSQYRHAYDLHGGWEKFVEDFEAHWPARDPKITVEFIRKGVCGRGAEREGDPKWRRLCEGDVRVSFHSKAKIGSIPRSVTLPSSLFDFDAPGSVAEATHAGLPWLGYVREQLGEELHLWPMDGWVPDENRSVIAEVYPALLNTAYPRQDRDSHQQNAYTVTRWMREADAEDEQLLRALHPPLPRAEKDIAHWEGWILGVGLVTEDSMPKKTKAGAGKKTKPDAAKKAKGKAVQSAAKKPGKKTAQKAAKKANKPAKTSRARERIHEFVDKFHGKLVTPRQLFFLEATLGSLDDTLDENEVLSILESMPPDFSNIPRNELRLIHIDGNFRITTYPAPPAPHDPDEYCRLHPRR